MLLTTASTINASLPYFFSSSVAGSFRAAAGNSPMDAAT
jgi:hypothetical protein